jgi:uncharacterized protein YdiU (UPF0061 family)
MIEAEDDEDLIQAIFWLLSRNETKSSYKASSEEFLLEFLEEMNRAYQKDLRQLREKDKNKESMPEDLKHANVEADSAAQYPKFMQAIARKSEEYKHEHSKFRRVSCMPSFVLSLVMVSRVSRHYTHASWFKVSTFNQMVEVHGAVSNGCIFYDRVSRC